MQCHPRGILVVYDSDLLWLCHIMQLPHMHCGKTKYLLLEAHLISSAFHSLIWHTQNKSLECSYILWQVNFHDFSITFKCMMTRWGMLKSNFRLHSQGWKRWKKKFKGKKKILCNIFFIVLLADLFTTKVQISVVSIHIESNMAPNHLIHIVQKISYKWLEIKSTLLNIKV